MSRVGSAGRVVGTLLAVALAGACSGDDAVEPAPTTGPDVAAGEALPASGAFLVRTDDLPPLWLSVTTTGDGFTFRGTAGCNLIEGSARPDRNGTLTIDGVSQTEAGCGSADITRAESPRFVGPVTVTGAGFTVGGTEAVFHDSWSGGESGPPPGPESLGRIDGPSILAPTGATCWEIARWDGAGWATSIVQVTSSRYEDIAVWYRDVAAAEAAGHDCGARDDERSAIVLPRYLDVPGHYRACDGADTCHTFGIVPAGTDLTPPDDALTVRGVIARSNTPCDPDLPFTLVPENALFADDPGGCIALDAIALDDRDLLSVMITDGVARLSLSPVGSARLAEAADRWVEIAVVSEGTVVGTQLRDADVEPDVITIGPLEDAALAALAP